MVDNLHSPKVSAYIPSFNNQDTIEASLHSLLNQTISPAEVFVVDDGSTDHTENIVRSSKDERVKYIRGNRNKYRYPSKSFYHWLAGPVEAANIALCNVTGEWIARIDDDDEWTEDHLQVLLDFAVKGQYEFVSSDLLMKHHDGDRVVTVGDDPKDNTGIGATQTWLYKSCFRKMKYNIHCWRKSYFRVNDTDLQQRFFNAGVKIGYLKKVTAMIEPRDGEKFIGSKAYIQHSEKYEKFYR